MTENTVKTPFYIEPIIRTDAAKWSYFSLIFSAFYFFNLIARYDRYTSNELLIAAGIYIVFILLYIQAIRTTANAAIKPIIAIILLSSCAAYINPGANTLFGYAAFFTGYYFLPNRAFLLLGLNVLGQVISAFAFDIVSIYYLGPSLACSLGLFVFGIFSQKEYLHGRMQEKKNQQIEQLSTIAERERIARDMHDLLGHSLSSLALKSELAEKLAAKQQFDAAKKEIAEVASLARQTLAEVRYAVTGLKQKGLVGTIERLTNDLKQMNFETTSNIQVGELSAKVESTLIMLSKEWITNILRHSKGDRVSMTINSTSKDVNMTITDNGNIANFTAGNGIDGMRSRVAELDGFITITHNDGVKLEVTLPLINEQTAVKVSQ
ncbi:sensor histidine kinase [uncultured Psychrosphaera sp.]|uniref:sensor histidine kinase n=1 Tax=uncultured Psychrosphaera sp. TaxID=1403522 RepID=UPI002620B3A4|nr:sensor histidine kinase [uncultured Psychrosphaera sp.]